MWQDRGLPAGRFGGCVGARGDFWAGRGCRRAPGPLCPLCSHQESHWGSHFPWVVESRPGIFSCTSVGWREVDLELKELGLDRSCSLRFAVAGAAGMRMEL